MKKRIFLAFASLAMLVFVTGCGKVPQEQIDAVNAAIETAKQAEADVYVPAQFAALQDEMNQIMTKVEAEKSKTFKSFKEVKELLAAMPAKAAAVAESVAAAKEEVKVNTEALFVEIDGLLTAHKDLLKKAPKGKEGRAVLEEMKNEVAVIEGSIAEAKALFEQGSFKAAFDKATAAKDSITAINNELTEAIAKVR